MTNKLYIRIALHFLILLGTAMVAIMLWFYITVGRSVANDVHTMLRSHAGFINAMVSAGLEQDDPEETCRQLFDLVSGRLKVESALLDHNGQRLIASDALAGKSLQLPAHWLEEIEQNGLFAQSSHFGKQAIYVMPLNATEQKAAYLYTTRPSSRDGHHGAFLVGVLIIGVLLTGAIYPLSKSITRPLSDLTRSLEKISGGNFEAGPVCNRQDEIGTLLRSYREMSRSVDKMIRASKQLLADISHELRSPLTRIRVGTELLRKNVSGEKAERRLQSIDKEIDSLDRLVTSLAAYSSMNLPGFVLSSGPVSPTHLINRLHERYQPISEIKNLDFSVISDKKTALITGDQELLSRVMTNLLDNAFHHTPAGGNITMGARDEGNSVCFFVTDTGPGVPESHRDRIFDPLYRVDPSRNNATGGAGLGLSIARGIVALHGGLINYSRENGVTRFSFYINKS